MPSWKLSNNLSSFPDNFSGLGVDAPEIRGWVWLKVGSVIRPHGLRGWLYIRLRSGKVDWWPQVSTLLLARAQGPYLKWDESTSQWQQFRSWSSARGSHTTQGQNVPGCVQVFGVAQLERIWPHKRGYLTVWKGLSDRTQAERFGSVDLWLPVQQLKSPTGELPFLMELLGFEVFVSGRRLGLIVDFESYPHMDLARVQTSQGLVSVGLWPGWIQHLDYQCQQIWLELPDGWFEVFEPEQFQNDPGS